MQRWFEISRDPNSPEVMQSRRTILAASRGENLINSRIEYLCDLVKEKSVLDVGVVEHTSQAMNSPNWLHKHLYNSAKTCLGVDILDEEIKNLQSLGFNVIHADITKQPLDQKFDVIICGEVLEHLDIPAYLLKNAVQMLMPGGRLVLSVPNPWYVNVIIKNIFNGAPYVDNADHVAWFDPCTLCELGLRHGLILERFAGIAVKNTSSFRTKVFFSITPLLIRLGLQAELFAKTMIYEFVSASK